METSDVVRALQLGLPQTFQTDDQVHAVACATRAGYCLIIAKVEHPCTVIVQGEELGLTLTKDGRDYVPVTVEPYTLDKQLKAEQEKVKTDQIPPSDTP